MRQEDKKLDEKVFFNRDKSAKMMRELCGFVALSLIHEIECEFCKHKNKAKRDWVLRFGKDVCDECGEELPLEKIYGTPTKDYIDFVLDDEDPKLTSGLKEDHSKHYNVPTKPKKHSISEGTLRNPVDYIDPRIPDPIEEGLKKYIKELEELERKGKLKRKSVIEEGEKKDKDEFHKG